MHCRLCNREAELRNSHIVPEFLYKPMYDDKHRFLLISSDPNRREEFIQKGLREKLLCHQCEQRFSVWENYGRGVIYGGAMLRTKQEPGCLRLKDVDYAKFRLFLHSLLWRMSVSEHHFFAAVNLGPYEEKLRLMLMADDPGDECRFPCLINGVLMNGQAGNWFLPADRVKCFGLHSYRVVLGGMLFIFFVSSQKPPKEAMDLFLKRDTSFAIPVRDIRDIPFLADIGFELSQAMQARPICLRRR